MPTAAIIVASGSSRRMGFDKLAAPLGGKTVLWHSVKTFCEIDAISQVVVVTPPERFDLLKELGSKIIRVDGGSERSDSVAKGLQALPPETTHVAIHDGARPLVTGEAVARTISKATECKAAALARKVTETLKRATTNQLIAESVDRENLWIMETPQVFCFELLSKAYSKIQQGDPSITDEVSALQTIGHQTTLIENLSPNPKITLPSDLKLAEILLHKSVPPIT